MCRSINARQAKATWDATESQLTLTGLSNDFSSVLVKIVIDRSGHQETLVGSKWKEWSYACRASEQSGNKFANRASQKFWWGGKDWCYNECILGFLTTSGRSAHLYFGRVYSVFWSCVGRHCHTSTSRFHRTRLVLYCNVYNANLQHTNRIQFVSDKSRKLCGEDFQLAGRANLPRRWLVQTRLARTEMWKLLQWPGYLQCAQRPGVLQCVWSVYMLSAQRGKIL